MVEPEGMNPRDHNPTWLLTGDVRPRELRILIMATQSGADAGLRTKSFPYSQAFLTPLHHRVKERRTLKL